MASITSSSVVESVAHGSTKRNLYRYILDTGETHYRRSWIANTVTDSADLAARGAMLLYELATAEFEDIINA